ncbi:hypothetical protein C359_03368, partial [Cryptococcus neoformans Bt120]
MQSGKKLLHGSIY